MNVYLLLLLRTIHIFAGVMWVGSAIFYLFLVGPTVKSIGPSGQKFMDHFIGRQRYPMYMGIIATLTIVSGILLFPSTSGSFQISWMKTGPGLGFTIGSLVGIAVFFVGGLMVKPRVDKLGKLGQQLSTAGSSSSPSLLMEIEEADQKLRQAEYLDFILLSVSLLLMAIARYLPF
jgi:uncharacterized membrane protein